ncbi:hypothetical protein DSAG12_02682 [Promethearchaeum syntrophicum]|uniref:Uncharacterized protein n=1 Tax=Promethearchaeum syntrophicum TaxID=2594042 RepID=A0A5B9DCL1_9ARCH|nr:hypothetical protein [Candidatus Prometheoarchaeum syntrophicum]QEE16852.1 hypothetical protein DSAG12_02682 [Candidatus Prometheoarchaeum syntrophicum]
MWDTKKKKKSKGKKTSKGINEKNTVEFSMASFNRLNRNKIGIVAISVMFSVLIASNSSNVWNTISDITIDNDITLKSNESVMGGVDSRSSGESYTFYEDTKGIANKLYVSVIFMISMG